MSKSLLLLCKKDRHECFTCDLSEALSKMSNLLKKSYFLCFWKFFNVFPLFYAKEWIALLALCSVTFLKSDRDKFILVTHDKRAMGAIYSFSRANHSFANKNQQFTWKTDERSPDTALHQVKKQHFKVKFWIWGLITVWYNIIHVSNIFFKNHSTQLCQRDPFRSGTVLKNWNPSKWLTFRDN